MTSTLVRTAPSPRAALLATVSEAEFQQWVIAEAERQGWQWWHNPDSRRVNAGFPDLLLLRSGRLVLAELKTTRGRLTRRQRDTLEELQAVEGIECHLWRPSDEDEIRRVLARETEG